MKSFVDIKTFFSNKNDRTIGKLGKLYEDKELLFSSIKDLIFSHLQQDFFKEKKVLLKPNLVKQNSSPLDEICLFTHPNIILATLKVILENKPKSIIVGDAPVQDCHWEEMLHQDFYDAVRELSEKFDVPISVCDFRKVIFDSNTNTFGKSKRSDNDYLVFDVANRSWLDPITEEGNKFRVTNYDPDRMKVFHSKGMHKYCVAKELFEADIVITMPKTKTHRMACLTNSLKVLVGIIGDKDYLPHHRIGSKDEGGDCYKDRNILRTGAERLIDFANRHKGAFYYLFLKYFIAGVWRISRPNKGESMAGTWYGNDTVWRMVMDLNIIALYGKKDGSLADAPQRTIFTLCDAIIGGQNDGPLRPQPVASGVLFFSNDSFLSDEVAGNLFKLRIDRIPLLKQAAKINTKTEYDIILNGCKVKMEDIRNVGISAEVPKGWIGYDEL